MNIGSNGLQAVLFDLDGVIVDTARYHYQAWKWIADTEEIYFNEVINERLKGVSRMESLHIIMERRKREYTGEELEQLAGEKNRYYVSLLEQLVPEDILSGVLPFISDARKYGIKTAICSASKNTDIILEKLKISSLFDTVVSGNDTVRSKPDPQVFSIAARRLRIPAKNCLVIEDSAAGIEAAISGGMKSIGIGEQERLFKANFVVPATEGLHLETAQSLFGFPPVETQRT